jgi:phosphoribosylformylglycinamidine cyclo-ligase
MDYREAGVDISAADAAKARIKALARGTFNPGVLSEIGSFGGMFRPDLGRYREPVLVASTDGVGTKIQVARAMDVHDTVGYDLVAHCVNDILVQGAVPLFFLDYIALGTMDPERVEQIVSGFARGCAEFGCPLLGGETAEMPGTYAPGDYDLAGFIVGVVEKELALTGRDVREGDVLLGLPSSGLHTNGYSLARKALFDAAGLTVDTERPELGTTVGRALLSPHRSYLAALEPLLARRKVRALAHITGGGFPGNLPRVLPDGLGARVRTGAWTVPAIFRLIRAAGQVPDEEMYRTFNMGIGMVVVVAPGDLHDVEHSLERRGETSHVIGQVERGAGVTLE